MSDIRRVLLFLVALSSAIGYYLFPVVIGGVSFFLFRILVICIPIILLSQDANAKNLKASDVFLLLFFLTWICSAFIGMFFLAKPEDAFNEVVSIISYLALFITIMLYRQSALAKAVSLSYGFLFSFYCTGTIALWELLTKNHLKSTFYKTDTKDYGILFTSSTFGNPNNYAAYLAIVYPLVYFCLRHTNRKLIRFFAIGAMVGAPLLIAVTGSRLALLAILLEIIVIARIEIKAYKNKSLTIVITALAAIGVYVLAQFGKQLFIISKFVSLAHDMKDSSGSTRTNLYLNAIVLFIRNPILGGGPGSFTIESQAGRLPFDTNDRKFPAFPIFRDPKPIWHIRNVIVARICCIRKRQLLKIQAIRHEGSHCRICHPGNFLLGFFRSFRSRTADISCRVFIGSVFSRFTSFFKREWGKHTPLNFSKTARPFGERRRLRGIMNLSRTIQ